MRIERIISLLPTVESIAEVGCDHALLTKRALDTGKAKRAIVSDISDTCLNKARVTLFGRDNVTFVVVDGVPSDVDVDCIILAGMGGHTIADIIARYDGNADLLLSPQSHSEVVREMLIKKGYVLREDTVFEADGKYYDLAYAEKGVGKLTNLQVEFGAFYERKNTALKSRLLRRLGNLRKGGDENAEEIQKITEILKWQE